MVQYPNISTQLHKTEQTSPADEEHVMQVIQTQFLANISIFLPYLHYRKEIFYFIHTFKSLTDLQEPSWVVRPETDKHILVKEAPGERERESSDNENPAFLMLS